MSAHSLFVLILGASVAAMQACAVVDQGVIPEFVVRDKALQEDQSEQMKPDAVAARLSSLSDAEQRAKRVHNLPPDQIAAWVEGRVTESDVAKLSSEEPPLIKPVKVSVPPRRLFRLILTGIGALALGLLFVVQRRHPAIPRPHQERL